MAVTRWLLWLLPALFTASAKKEKQGLIIVDIQHDFASPSGSLSVFLNDENGYLNISSTQYIHRINKFIENEKDRFDFIAYSIDYHPSQHCSFASTMQALGANVSAFDAVYPKTAAEQNKAWSDDICLTQTGFQVLWPDHCVRGTDGSKFMSNLYDIRPLPHLQSEEDLRRVVIWRNPNANESYVTNYKLSGSQLMFTDSSFKDEIDNVLSAQTTTIPANVSQVMYIFKGRDENIDSYSVFDGNDGKTRTGLFDSLNAYDYTPQNTDLTIFGIAYDYCVVFTCRDAVQHGYHVTIMDQLTAPVFPADVAALKEEMRSIGMTINYTYGNKEVEEEEEESEEDESSDDGKSGKQETVLIGVIVVLSVIIVVLIMALVCVSRQKTSEVEFAAPPQQHMDTERQNGGGGRANNAGTNNAGTAQGKQDYDMAPLNPTDED